MLSVDRIIEFNDTAGNGKFDQSADTVLSYYGAKLYNQSSLLTPKQHAVHAANGDDVGDIAWHGGFAWDHVQSSVQYASPDAATDPTAEPQLDVVMVNITTLPPHAHASRFAPVGKVGLLSVEIIQEAQADDKKVEVREWLALHFQTICKMGCKELRLSLSICSTACSPPTDIANPANSAQD